MMASSILSKEEADFCLVVVLARVKSKMVEKEAWRGGREHRFEEVVGAGRECTTSGSLMGCATGKGVKAWFVDRHEDTTRNATNVMVLDMFPSVLWNKLLYQSLMIDYD